MSSRSDHVKRLAFIYVVGCLAANLAFFVLSIGYFESRRELVGGMSVPTFSPEQVMHVRLSFALLAGVLAVSGFVAGLWPRVVGHVFTVLFGVLNLVAIGIILVRGYAQPIVLTTTQLVFAALLLLLSWLSYYRHSRAAWAFLVALCFIFAVVELFGAPRIRNALDISLWTAMILPGLKVVAGCALVSIRDEYAETKLAPA